MKQPAWLLITAYLISVQFSWTEAFGRDLQIPRRNRLQVLHAQAPNPQGDIPEKEEEEEPSEADARLSDILPPTLSFSRNSILFSEKPVTQRNNEVLTFWRSIKATVPPVITGAWPWRDAHLADENPLGAFYNICFVRLPVIVTGIIYAKNLREGHPLIMDYGDGPLEVSPLIVLGVLAIVLA